MKFLLCIFDSLELEDIDVEHVARFHSGNLERSIEFYVESGYRLITRKHEVAFLKKDKRVIELIPPEPDWYEHVAFATNSQEDLGRIKIKLSVQDIYPVDESQNSDPDWFLVEIEGDMVQFIFRGDSKLDPGNDNDENAVPVNPQPPTPPKELSYNDTLYHGNSRIW